jgi:hypothetical protein
MSAHFPHATFRIWDNLRNIILEVTGIQPEDVAELKKEPMLIGDTRAVQEDKGSIRFFIEEYKFTGPAVSQIIKDNACWYLVPDEIKGGWEHFTIFSYTRENLHKLVDDIKKIGGEVIVTSIHELPLSKGWEPLLPVSSLFAGLTEKQIAAVSNAFSSGYFEEPSLISIEKLAERAGTSRSTFSEHLRKAERKILENVFSSIRAQDLERK